MHRPISFLLLLSLLSSSSSSSDLGPSAAAVASPPSLPTTEIPLGLIVSNWDQNAAAVSAIEMFLAQQRRNQTPVQFQLTADRISTVDAYKLAKIICEQVILLY